MQNLISDQVDVLKQRLVEHQLIFDNAIVGIGALHERVITRCNRRFEEIFGYGPGELDNQNVRILYPSTEAFDRIGRIGYGYLLNHNVYSDERVMKRKNGEIFWCNVDLKPLNSTNPQRDVVMIFQDISQRKASEAREQLAYEHLEQLVNERTRKLNDANEALRTEIRLRKEAEEVLLVSREKYRVLFETFPIGISITNDQGQVIEINQALRRIASRTLLATLMGGGKKTSMSLIRADGAPLTYEQLPNVLALKEQRVVADVEVGVSYGDSQIRWFSVTAAPIAVKGYGVVVTHTEITERKRTSELESLNRAELSHVSRLNMMGEMAATIIHELGQPLSATLNYLHGCELRLESKDYAPELFHSAISQAICNAERAAAIVKHLRQQCMRQIGPEFVPTDINVLIEEMIIFLDFERRQYGITILPSLGKGLPTLLADPLEIKQVILNLFKNAIEAMSTTEESNRLLEVTTLWGQQRWIEVSVADRGHGVSKKQLARIFKPFFTTKQSGLGLGLAICRSIIEAHGGRLTAGNNLHGGATFRFTLPANR